MPPPTRNLLTGGQVHRFATDGALFDGMEFGALVVSDQTVETRADRTANN
jgi:hypothetical protein